MKPYIDLFITGVALGWGPCLSFCAPAIIAYIAGTQNNWLKGLQVSLTFSLARIFSYLILSIISASLGQYIVKGFYGSRAAEAIYIAAGVFVCLLGVFVLLGKSLPLDCFPFLKKSGTKGVGAMALWGLIVGFAPCLPLFAVLTYIAFNAEGLVHGVSLGLAFGCGTLLSPLILFGPMAATAAAFLQKRPLIYKVFSRSCGVVLLYLGVGMIR